MAQSQGAEQPTQEELQAYVEQMRRADAAEIVAQAFQILAMGAEVKLGRNDARVLIDALAAVVDATGGRVPAELTKGMRTAVSELQTVQVQQERAAGGDQSAADEPADTAERARQGQAGAPGSDPRGGRPAGAQSTGQQQGGPGGDNLTDRLWIPGR